MQIVKVNIMELASELAEREVLKHFDNKLELVYENPSDSITTYTEEAQDLFNNLYDEFWEMIENSKED
jgi:hypothetical protein